MNQNVAYFEEQATLALRRDDTALALRHIADAIALEEYNCELRLWRAEILTDSDDAVDWQQIITDCTVVIEHCTNQDDVIEALEVRALRFSYLGQVENTIKDLEQLKIKGKFDANRYHWLANLKYKMNLSNEAVGDLNEGIEIYPGHPELVFLRGHINVKLANFESAKADFTTVINQPKAPQFHSVALYNRGRANAELGYLRDALKDLLHSQDVTPRLNFPDLESLISTIRQKLSDESASQ